MGNAGVPRHALGTNLADLRGHEPDCLRFPLCLVCGVQIDHLIALRAVELRMVLDAFSSGVCVRDLDLIIRSPRGAGDSHRFEFGAGKRRARSRRSLRKGGLTCRPTGGTSGAQAVRDSSCGPMGRESKRGVRCSTAYLWHDGSFGPSSSKKQAAEILDLAPNAFRLWGAAGKGHRILASSKQLRALRTRRAEDSACRSNSTGKRARDSGPKQ